jgi:hypothetical protein
MPKGPSARATPRDYLVGLAQTLVLALVAALAMLALRSYWNGRQNGPDVGDANAIPASVGESTGSPGASDFLGLPSPSPDGRFLALVATYHGRGGLWRYRIEGRSLELIDEGTPVDSAPAWSPDGQTVAWLSVAPKREGAGVIRLTDAAAGKGVTALAQTDASVAAGLSWLPAAGGLAFVEPGSGGLRVLRSDAGGQWEVGEKPLAHGVECAAGGAGLRLARSSDGLFAYDDVSRHRLASAERLPLLDWVAPSPDGEVVALVEAPRLPNASVVELALAPAGYEAAPRYARGAPTWAESAPRPGWIEWSPDSTYLLYWFAQDGPPAPVGVFRDCPDADAIVVDRDKGEVVAQVRWPGKATGHQARWLDGDSILYLERTDDASVVWRVPWQSGKSRKIMELGEAMGR